MKKEKLTLKEVWFFTTFFIVALVVIFWFFKVNDVNEEFILEQNCTHIGYEHEISFGRYLYCFDFADVQDRVYKYKQENFTLVKI